MNILKLRAPNCAGDCFRCNVCLEIEETGVKIDNNGITVNEGTFVIKNKSDMDSFVIWNKQDYIKYYNDKFQNIIRINEYWNNVRKGYNFIVVDTKDADFGFYSVDFFNKMLV